MLHPTYRGHSEFQRLYLAGSALRTGHANELYQSSGSHPENELTGPLAFDRLAYEGLLVRSSFTAELSGCISNIFRIESWPAHNLLTIAASVF
ncbi:MAG: hypothetical protein JWO91_2463 [Acidobacteriaceae bacterium]|nr:hypothetical protein [Acidobacteriaceae bacterium]